MKRLFILLLFFPVLLSASVEDTLRRPISFSLFSNATKLPGSGFAGVFNTPVHPGFTLGTEFTYMHTETNKLFQTAKIGYFYHRLAQHAVIIFTEGGYRHTFPCGFSLQSLLGAGYLHSIPAIEIFEINDEGIYERTGKFGRPQGMAGLTLGFGYLIGKAQPIRIGLDYQIWFQFPFVQEYVPILPNTALHLSVTFSIPK